MSTRIQIDITIRVVIRLSNSALLEWKQTHGRGCDWWMKSCSQNTHSALYDDSRREVSKSKYSNNKYM